MMAVDNGIIDHDHQVLISIINDFSELRPTMGGTAELLRTLARLHHYVNTHFAREEHLQVASGFPSRLDHHLEHRKLGSRLDLVSERTAALDQVAILSMLHSQGSDDITLVDNDIVTHLITVHEEIAALLRTWVVDHIVKTDLPMRPYVDAMRPYAAKMSSLWAEKPALLVPNLDTPKAAKDALSSAKTWMAAGFRNEAAPLPRFKMDEARPGPLSEHPAISRMRKKAQRLGMVVDFDTQCTNFRSQGLNDAFAALLSAQEQSDGKASVDFSPSNLRPYLHQAALFERHEEKGGDRSYRSTHAGPKFMRIFGNVAGNKIDDIMPPSVAARWNLLLDGVLDYNAPLHVIGLAEAFGRKDLLVEGLLAPFRDMVGRPPEVLVVACYEMALE